MQNDPECNLKWAEIQKFFWESMVSYSLPLENIRFLMQCLAFRYKNINLFTRLLNATKVGVAYPIPPDPVVMLLNAIYC